MARAVVEARARIEARDGKITDKLLRAAGITTETSWCGIAEAKLNYCLKFFFHTMPTI